MSYANSLIEELEGFGFKVRWVLPKELLPVDVIERSGEGKCPEKFTTGSDSTSPAPTSYSIITKTLPELQIFVYRQKGMKNYSDSGNKSDFEQVGEFYISPNGFKIRTVEWSDTEVLYILKLLSYQLEDNIVNKMSRKAYQIPPSPR